ncbi:MAG TPA: TolC family protein [Gemmatimonadales bacterium]
MICRSAFVFVLALVPGLAPAQQPAAVPPRPEPTAQLSLSEALTQARSKSPAYRQVLNDAGPARVAVRAAYGAFLPQLDVRGGMGYVGSGSSTFGGSTFNQTSPSITSSYGVDLSLSLSGATLVGPATEKATQRAVEEDISNATITLDNDVTVQYLTALQAVAQTDVARQQVQRNTEFLELARARFQVGQATLLDVRQAEVTKGRSDLDLLVAAQAENEAKLELLRRIGVELAGSVTELALTDSFPVTEPAFDERQLLSTAQSDNPSLRALRAREDASSQNVKAARSQYLPTLSFVAGWSGFTQEFTNTDVLLRGRTENAKIDLASCDFQNALIGALPGGGVPGFPNGGIISDCRNFVGLDATGEALSPEIRADLLGANNVFPWSFREQPFQASLRISVPIFQGFSRNLQVARAHAAREDAEEAVRARQLQVRTEVQGRYLGIQTAWQAIAVQEGSRAAARDQLQLAQERFRLGNGSALEVTDAQTAVTRAEADYVNAVYAYHRAIAALEFAVGRRLR